MTEKLPEFVESGRGPVVVLLHGIGSAAQSWVEIQEALSSEFRVIAWNAPGYGQSTALEESDPEVGAYSMALETLWRHLNLGSAHLVGHSLGALIAAKFAADHPAYISSLTLMSAALGHRHLPEELRLQKLNARLNDLEKLGAHEFAQKRGPRLLSNKASTSQIQRVVEVMAQIHPLGYSQAARMLSRGDLTSSLQKMPYKLAVQFIVGSEDVITTPESNRQAAVTRGEVPVHIIPDAGHAVYVEAPTPVIMTLKRFFEGTDDK